MSGMEIFNSDDYSEDFLEVDDKLISGDVSQLKDNIIPDDSGDPTKKDQKKKDDDGEDKSSDNNGDVDNDDSEGLEVLLPSAKSDKNKDDISSDSSTLSPKFFSSLVQALKEGGVLEDIKEEDIKSQEDFFKVVEDGIKQREFSDLNDAQKEYLEALRAGIPHEDIAEHQQLSYAYDSITEDAIEEESTDGEGLRRTIITNNFVAKGFSDTKAKKLVDKIFDSGEDVAEAKDALSELKEMDKVSFERAKQQNMQRKLAQEKSEKEALDKLNKIVKETNEIIPGLKIPQTLKTNIIKGLTSPVGYTDDKRPLDIISKYLHENPIDGRFKLAYILSVTDNLTKMSTLENKKVKNDAWKNLAESIKFKEDGGGRTEEDGMQFDFDKFDFR